ncbi:MAG TPA: phosphatase PAP2 family protein [Bacteroidota bacterium]|nr:phosphatase PAP2 family protein [Bacteroidota bacterium]
MTSSFRYRIALLTTSDIATMIFLTIVAALAIIFSSVIPYWYVLAGCNILLVGLIPFLARKAQETDARALKYIRDWYPVPMIFYVFKETYMMVHPIHPQDFDWLLIQADRWIFGGDPTHWMMNFASPAVTEILQISYASYYLILLSVFFELSFEKRHTEYFLGAFLVIYGFYLSYVGYFLLPAVGPRFTLYDFNSLDTSLPGVWVTNALRDFVNAGESIPKGVTHAVDFAQRDAFPSGHTQLTLTILYIAFSNRLKSRWVLLVAGSLLIISTVYLRYHYAIDVIAGVLFFLFTVWSGRKIDAWWREYKRKLKKTAGVTVQP